MLILDGLYRGCHDQGLVDVLLRLLSMFCTLG